MFKMNTHGGTKGVHFERRQQPKNKLDWQSPGGPLSGGDKNS